MAGDLGVWIDVFQVPGEGLALELLPQGGPSGDVPVVHLGHTCHTTQPLQSPRQQDTGRHFQKAYGQGFRKTALGWKNTFEQVEQKRGGFVRPLGCFPWLAQLKHLDRVAGLVSL